MRKRDMLLIAAALSLPFGAEAQNSASEPLVGFYSESFAGCSYESVPWEVIPESGETATVHLVSHDSATGLVPHIDADGGMLVVENDKSGSFILALPWIYVSTDWQSPVIKYSAYVDPAVKVSGLIDVDGSGFVDDNAMSLLESAPTAPRFSLVSNPGYPPFITYAGKSVRFAMSIYTDGSGGQVIIDRVRFGDIPKYDFGIDYAYAPPVVEAGKDFTTAVRLRAYGNLGSRDYTLVVKDNGKTIAKLKSSKLDDPWLWEGNTVLAHIPVTAPHAICDMSLSFSIQESHDAVEENNTTEAKTVTVVSPELPVPTGLQYVVRSGEYDFRWSAPEISCKKGHVVDDLENLPAWSYGGLGYRYLDNPEDNTRCVEHVICDTGRIGDYLVIDGDHSVISVPGELGVPSGCADIAMSCILAEFTDESELSAYSGSKALVFLSNADGSVSDNYLVLPHVGGTDSEQIAFMARALGDGYPEKIEIMASSTGRGKEDFSRIGDIVTVSSSDWKRIEALIPEGTTYVALHHVSDSGRALIVDDMEYTAGAPSEILGYNIYAGTKKVNDTPVKSTEISVSAGYADYHVTALYREGESGFSISATEASGVDMVISGTTGEEASGIRWYNLQGVGVDAPVAGGIYIRVQGNSAEKIIMSR